MIPGPLYTVEATVISIILAIIVLYYFSYVFCEVLKKKIDYEFFLGTIPFILFFTLLRTLVDIGVLQKNIFTVSPGIWIIGLLVGVFSYLCVLRFYGTKVDRYFFLVWLIPFFTVFIYYFLPHLRDWISLAYFSFLYMSFVLVGYVFLNIFEVYKKENMLVLAGQLVDGVAAPIGIVYKKYAEEHILTWILMNITHPFLFILVKLFLTLAVLYYIDKKIKINVCYKNLIKFGIFVVGLGPGFRNLILILI